MSTFSYSGIILEPILTKTYSRRAIFHGPTYLYTRHLMRVQGIYNPTRTSYDEDDGRYPSQHKFIRKRGQAAAQTDYTIRHQLMQPRQKLYYTSGNPNCKGEPHPFSKFNSSFPVVEYPPTDDNGTPIFDITITDCNLGPIPISCDVTRIGANTWWVDLAIKTDINECFKYFSQPPLVLSNRWNMTHDVDLNQFTTRYVRGRAIFRTDVLLDPAKKYSIDNFRSAFFFPIPDNFQRESVRVWINEDGNELHYSFVDREKSHTILMENVTRIEAWASFSVTKPSFIDAGIRAAEKAGKAVVGGAVGTATGVAIGGPAGGAVGAVGGAATQVVGIVRGFMPITNVNLNIRVWGNRNAKRSQLVACANEIVKIKMPQALAKLASKAFTVSQTGTYDLMGRYVGVSVNLLGGQLAAALGSTGLGLLGSVDKEFPELIKDDIIAANPKYSVARATSGPGRAMPNAFGSRGTYLEKCVAQALQEPCGNPAYPATSAAQDSCSIPEPRVN